MARFQQLMAIESKFEEEDEQHSSDNYEDDIPEFDSEDNNNVDYSSTTTFTFGKHKGKTFKSVYKTNNLYMDWCYKEMKRSDHPNLFEFIDQERKNNPTPPASSDYTMPFGKHKGLTLEQIKKKDKKYLDWCTQNLDSSKNKDLLRKINKIL